MLRPVLSPLSALVGGRIMAPNNAYILISRTCGYVIPPGKEEINVADRIKIANHLTLYREINMDSLGGTNAITRSLKVEKRDGRGQNQSEEDVTVEERHRDAMLLV